MEKLDLQSPDLTARNIEALAELFPTVVTETRDADGTVRRGIDFDLLRQELSDHVVEGPQERYRLDWPGKRKALLAANAPIRKTLRPVREESVNFDNTKDLFIEGDNLEALKLLQESYLGKVKLIYIDPPYNTGNDFIYNDDFAETTAEYLERSGQIDESGARLVANTESNGRFHSDWLSMMYPRLRLARNLLRHDGVIVISIDDSEIASVITLCNEIFSPHNHVETLVWKRRYGGGAKEKHFASIHEYLVVVARDLGALEELFVDLTDEQIARYFTSQDDLVETRGPYRTQPMEPAASMGDRPNLRFPITAPDGSEIWPKRQWLWSRERVSAAISSGALLFTQPKGSWNVSIKQYLRDDKGEQRKTKATSIIEGIYGQSGGAELKALFDGVDVFPYAKPSALIGRLISIFAPQGSIVLDFFAGSGSTFHGALARWEADGQPRHLISVQLPEMCAPESNAGRAGYSTIAELAKERIRRVGHQIGTPLEGSSVDVGFRVLKVDTPTTADVGRAPGDTSQDQLSMLTDSVVEGRTSEDLLFHVLLDWGLELSLPIVREAVGDSELFVVDEGLLIACFAESLTREGITTIAQRQPERAVFRDSAFVTDADRINAQQVFAQLAPHTELRTV